MSNKYMAQSEVRFLDLEGKNVVVTGAGKGIGRAIAEGFVLNKCKVYGFCRNTKSQHRARTLEPLTNFDTINLDIRDTQEIQAWIEEFENSGKFIDILINNAAINNFSYLVDVSEDEWDNIFSVNLKSTFFISQLYANHMSLNNGGVIINITSFASKMPSMGYGVYAASKSALLSLTKSMAAEWAIRNIRVNAVSPGVIHTDMTKSAIEENREKLLSQISQRAFGMPQDVANLVLFLASNASSYITGSEIDISGGKFIVQTAR